jgi:hypothetical protein
MRRSLLPASLHAFAVPVSPQRSKELESKGKSVGTFGRAFSSLICMRKRDAIVVDQQHKSYAIIFQMIAIPIRRCSR